MHLKAKFHDPMFNRSEVIMQTNRRTDKQTDTVRSMRWFSNRRSPSPPSGHAMVSSVAACCIRPSYGARPSIHCQWGWLSSFSFFVPVIPWPLTLNFELGRDFCTTYLTAELDRRMFSHSEVIGRTNKQTDTLTSTLTNKQAPQKTYTSLRYTTPVGNH